MIKPRQKDDFQTASLYLDGLATAHTQPEWLTLEASLLEMYAKSLNKLGRVDDFVRIALKTISRNAMLKEQGLSRASSSIVRSISLKDQRPTSINDVVEASKSMTETIKVPLNDFFKIDILPFVQHDLDRDGFSLEISLTSYLHEALDGASFSVQLVHVADAALSREINLQSEGSLQVGIGDRSVRVFSKVQTSILSDLAAN